MALTIFPGAGVTVVGMDALTQTFMLDTPAAHTGGAPQRAGKLDRPGQNTELPDTG